MIFGILATIGHLLSEKDMDELFTLSLAEFILFDWFFALLYFIL